MFLQRYYLNKKKTLLLTKLKVSATLEERILDVFFIILKLFTPKS